jgi:plasmid stabilization system protein ParE
VRRLRLSKLARDDIDEIAAFIARDDFAAALRVIESLHAAARQLARMPGIGHRRPDLTSRRVRSWPVRPYLVVYRRTKQGVEIVRVLHAARDAVSLMREEE